MSASWWRSQHNRHHAMPQRLKHDVDLETMPLIAFNSRVIRNPQTTKDNFFIRNQAWLYLTLDSAIVMLVWKLYLHPRYAWKKGSYFDLFFMTLHYLFFSMFLNIWWYLVVTWIASTYMMSQFAMSHSHLEVADEPKHWVEYCLLHTVDVEPSWWCDWVMGYLNYQIVCSGCVWQAVINQQK
jgi:fatty acid desaturase 2 (delta-6 desaturase)